MKIEIPDSIVESTVKSIMENFPEASQAFECRRWRYETWEYIFYDYETKTEYKPTKTALIAAFDYLFTKKWPKGCVQPPNSGAEASWDNWLCRCDATDFDAFIQLACLGEVIYG